MVSSHSDEPVVAVHDVELEPVSELDAGRQHVDVHVLDPRYELAELGWPAGFTDPMKRYPRDRLFRGRLLAAARQDVDVDSERSEVLRQLPHVARQATLDQRRVLPREDQDPHQGAPLGASGLPQAEGGSRIVETLSPGASPRSFGDIAGESFTSRRSAAIAPSKAAACSRERSSGYSPASSREIMNAQSLD